MNFYKRHLGDYAKDAGHLSMLEHGAYTLLLDRYYTTEVPISMEDAYRICRARSKDEKAAADVVLREFFTVVEGAYQNRRADEEIAKASHQREVNRAIGLRGGRPKLTDSATEHITESVPVRNPSQTPDTRQRTTPPPPKGGAVSGFEKFWKAYPSNDRKVAKRQCYEKWQRRSLESLSETIVAAVEAMAKSARWQEENGRFVPAPLVYLNQDRWEAEAAPPPPAPPAPYVHPTLTPAEREASNKARIAMLAARKGIAA